MNLISANEPHSPSDPITLVISEVVKPDQIQAYEAWVSGINHAAKQVEGFLGVDVIRPRDHDYPEYVVILKFESYKRLRCWLASPTYKEWMAAAGDFFVSRSYQKKPTGMELWFSLPAQSGSGALQSPPYYKKVVLGVLGVYPLILLANALLGPALKDWPYLLGLLFSVTVVSALLTYPVMPWLTQALGFWLYPPVSPRHGRRN